MIARFAFAALFMLSWAIPAWGGEPEVTVGIRQAGVAQFQALAAEMLKREADKAIVAALSPR